jgi:hypothetical protein
MALTKEQIEEALKSDEVKAAIKTAVDGEVEGLKKKNGELLGDMKDLKKKFETLEEEKAEAEEKAASKSGNVDEVKKQLEAKHTKEIEKLTGTITKLSGQLETHVIGEGLTQALVKAKVQPALMDAAKALIKTNFKGEVGDNDGKPFAKFDGKAVEDFVTGWAQTESGKHFVAADNNQGGGSNGANGSGKAGNDGKKTMTRKDFDALSPADKMKTSKDGVSLTD